MDTTQDPSTTVWSRRPAFSAVLIAVVGLWVMVVFVGFYPGLLSADPLTQLDQGLTGNYTNVHPPLLSAALGLAFRWSGSVWPAFLLQLLVFSGAFALLLARIERPRVALALAAAFFCLPPVWSTVAAVWKDVAMAATLLLGVSLLAYRRPWPAALCIALAGSMRLNALLAAVPLLAPASAQLLPLAARKKQVIFASVLGVAVAMTPTAVAYGTRARDVWALGWVLTDDLASIYAQRPDLFAGSTFEREVSAKELGQLYNVGSSVPLFFGPEPPRRVNLDRLPDRRSELKSEWARTVVQVPLLYLEARAARFRRLLGADLGAVQYPFHQGVDPNPYGLAARDHTMLHRGLRAAQTRTQDGLLFRGWFWLVLLATATGASIRLRKTHALALWTCASAATYLLAYFFVAPAADFRYLFWPLVATFAAAALLASPGASAGTAGSINS